MMKMAAIVVTMLATASVPAGADEPRFAAFPAGAAYHGTPRMPDFAHRDRAFAMFRTVIIDAMHKGANFDGRYALIRFGCGTGCVAVDVANLATGRVYRFPLSGEKYERLDLKFQPDSALVSARWWDAKKRRCVRTHLEWKGTRAELLREDAINKDECG
jgi:hypothetical protein